MPSLPTTTPFHRLQWRLCATHNIRLPARQRALLYALLASANATAEAPAAFPRDLLLDAPEENRLQIRVGEPYHFGGTLLASDSPQAQAVIERLSQGLCRLGTTGKPRAQGLGGNFRIEAVTDLVARRDLGSQSPGTISPISVQDSVLTAELRQLQGVTEVTLEFGSPLRLERRGEWKREHESFFSGRSFEAPYFINRLLRRMATVGVLPKSEVHFAPATPAAVTVIENRLVWLDLAYGGPRGKSLGGAVGRVRLKLGPHAELILAALVWGQWTRVGKNTAFGFGRYRIHELGAEPYPCRRAMGLLDLAWSQPQADRLSSRAGLDAGVLSQAIHEIANQTYEPQPPNIVEIGVEPKRRTLVIPTRRDRVLQRLVLEQLGPALDAVFESSSFAWRKGLGRHHSAKAISQAFRQGYRFAVRADFDRYFDSIDHAALEDRLRAYVGDEALVALVFRWLRDRGDAPNTAGQGLPTGAPLSPLLGNLFLDEFDERIGSRGGKLVRYGDDFLILCRTQAQALEYHTFAQEEAEALQLRLNELPEPILPLDEPFTFLGFEFRHRDGWEIVPTSGVRAIEELGWQEASSSKPPSAGALCALPGETGGHLPTGFTAIVGPEATHLEWQSGHLRCHYSHGLEPTQIPLQGLETLVVIGRIGISAEILERLTKESITLVLADHRGLPHSLISADESIPPQTLLAQVDALRDGQARLSIARSILGAKLHNYRRLAESLATIDEPYVRSLERSLNQASAAQTVEQLRGIEGYAAAGWFRVFPQSLGPGFSFERRVAPDADDPVNVLLNIAHTLGYRLALLSLRAAGLAPSIGYLHEPNGRFAPLACDLQEPFRPLMERAVIEATHQLRPSDFRSAASGPYALVMEPQAARQFQALLWRAWTLATISGPAPLTQTGEHPVASGESEHQTSAESGQPAPYRTWLERQARGLRRALVADRGRSFRPFCWP